MKNRQNILLVALTGIFVVFTLGFFAGRNFNHTDVQVTSIARVSAQVPSEYIVTEAAEGQPSAAVQPDPAQETSQSSGLININTATISELTTLPGIGEVLAQRIIDYRETAGPFTAVTQLTQVSGIGENRLTVIIDLITVG